MLSKSKLLLASTRETTFQEEEAETSILRGEENGLEEAKGSLSLSLCLQTPDLDETVFMNQLLD